LIFKGKFSHLKYRVVEFKNKIYFTDFNPCQSEGKNEIDLKDMEVRRVR